MTEQKKEFLIACDAGGTMTDVLVIDEEGFFYVGKAATTPKDESVGFIESLADATSIMGIDFETRSKEIVPAVLNTVYTGTSILNTLVTRTGKRVGLIVTKGFEYTLQEGRAREAIAGYSVSQIWHSVYRAHKEPLVPFRRIQGVTERIDLTGKVLIPLYEHEVAPAVERLLDEDVECLGICFLFSFMNPAHEKRAAEIAREVMKKRGKEVPIYLSCEVAPVKRETSRMNSLVVQAYATEHARSQLFRIEDRLKEEGFRFPLQVVLAYGTAANIRYPRIYESTASGPIGGIIGAAYLGSLIGENNIVCSDMGGTSFDVGRITDGLNTLEREPEFQRMFLNLPMLDVTSIGAGAGTYIRIDPLSNSVELGPDSAGADPGLVCYDMGNETPCVGDCDLILGRLNPDYYLGGKVKLNKDKAYRVFKEKIADKLGLDVYEAAEGLIKVLDARMGDYLRTTLLGFDLRDYILMGYGGATGMHLAGYAGDLPWKGICTMPWAAGFSAFGCTAMPYAHRYSRSVAAHISHGASESEKMTAAEIISNVWSDFEQVAVRDMEEEGVSRKDVSFRYFMYAKYYGQFDDVEVWVPVRQLKSAEDMDRCLDAFEGVYGTLYPLVAKEPTAGYMITEVGLISTAPKVKPLVRKLELMGKEPPEKAWKEVRPVYIEGGWKEAKIFELDEIQPGNEVEGLAILEGPSYTLLVPPDKKLSMDQYRVIWLKAR